jgi:hypothetical protein
MIADQAAKRHIEHLRETGLPEKGIMETPKNTLNGG